MFLTFASFDRTARINRPPPTTTISQSLLSYPHPGVKLLRTYVDVRFLEVTLFISLKSRRPPQSHPHR